MKARRKAGRCPHCCRTSCSTNLIGSWSGASTCFVRYADDCNIYVRSRRAGKRVMQSITGFITRRLKLKVNEAEERGGSTGRAQVPRLQLHGRKGSKAAYRRQGPGCVSSEKVRELTGRTRGISIEQMTKELASYLRGWKSYFGFCQTPSVLRNLDQWIRRRLRSVIWKQWKRGKVRFARTLRAGREQAPGGANGRELPRPVADQPTVPP